MPRPRAARRMNREVRQASCVLVNGRGLLIEGPPGSGKSGLALALIDRGARLVGDDGVRLEARQARVWANPPPNTEGLIEIRNVGIARLPCSEGVIALLLRLAPDAPRFVEEAEQAQLCGCEVPQITLWPDTPALPLRAEWALRLHGLA